MNAKLQSIEIEMGAVRDDEFAIEDAFVGKLLAKRIEHLGEVAVEGFFVAALKKNFIAIAENEYAKAIPLGLVDPVAFCRDLLNALGEHGKDRRIDGEIHWQVLMMRPEGVDAMKLAYCCPFMEGVLDRIAEV